MASETNSPSRQLLPSPPKHVPTFLSYPHAGQSQRGVPVSLQLEKETMDSLELDMEVIRCKTCGLVQYRTRTGNCRRCVRALPQRLEFLIPPPEAPEETVAGPPPKRFPTRRPARISGSGFASCANHGA